MKIFISHSLKDKSLVNGIKSLLEPHGLILLIAEHYLGLTGTISQKIKTMIDNCDVALIVLTENGFNSNFVQQEIGYINSANKPYLQLVQKGLQRNVTGFNYGKDMIVFDPRNPTAKLNQTRDILLNFWQQKIHYNNQQEQERKESNAKAALGILAGIFILGALGSDD